ncbi:sodium/potassium-transporting ATPase subunit beta-233-like [Poeciliopsis prolifica]|uniref:sodium/potassium-transporting ATPase subunit beta-233-like n=1 Tax=Poeciliopsis prolifica TaxID=188132 RepID=UPI0024139DBC|nr:sodium/potassium-transporting ATPase subunit beta-233-like [Poeciliopsis prolifica]XP_054886503.1 sodium/potassium-transporting ATPase subunit beta-233-like [Poeciliopsis prolifica]
MAGKWMEKIWNSETGEFCGRTGNSWLKISMFYVFFYAFLIGVFSCTIIVLLKTLPINRPKHQDRILPAGLSFEPYAHNFDIVFSQKNPISYEKYVKSLKAFIERYQDDKQTDDLKYEDCGSTPTTYTERGEVEGTTKQKKSCRFSRKVLQECSGETDDTFGFKEGKPCLLLKINRVIDYRPKPPTSSVKLPDELSGKPLDNVVPVHCTNRWKRDDGLVGEVKYFGFGGIGGFPMQYYPYYGKRLQSNYLQPLVGVKFANLTRNKEIRLQCRMYGSGYNMDTRDGLFYVHITVND